MSAPPDAVMQAILALCEHTDTYHPDCPQCLFRAEAAAEHLKHVIQETIDSLNSKDGMKNFIIHLVTGKQIEITGFNPGDSEKFIAALGSAPDGNSTITKSDGNGWIVNRAHVTHIEILNAA